MSLLSPIPINRKKVIPWPNQLDITLQANGIIEIEGIKISIVLVKEFLLDPPEKMLSFKRITIDGITHMQVTQYDTIEAAAKFFGQANLEPMKDA